MNSERKRANTRRITKITALPRGAAVTHSKLNVFLKTALDIMIGGSRRAGSRWSHLTKERVALPRMTGAAEYQSSSFDRGTFFPITSKEA